MAITNVNQIFAGGDNLLKVDSYEQDRRLRHRLEVQTDQIEKVFAHHAVKAEVSGGVVRSGAFSYEMKTHLQDGLDRLRIIKNDLVNALGVSDVRLNRENGRLRLSVGRSHPHTVDLLDLHAIAPVEEGVSVILGLDDEGRMIMLNLADENLGNILVSGTSAAGKSGLLRTLAVSLALANRQSQVQMGIIAAPSGQKGLIARPNLVHPLNFLPHVLFPVVSSMEESVEVLQFLTDEVTYREETGLDWPLLVILIDNADVLLDGGDYAISSLLTRLATATPAAGVRLILSATHPESGELGRILKHNVSLRITGRTARNRDQWHPDDSTYLNGQGDFLAKSYGTSTRFQAAFIDDYDLHMTLEDLHRRQDIVLLARSQGQDSGNGEADESGSQRLFVTDSSNGEVTLDQEPPEFMQIVDELEDNSKGVECVEELKLVDQSETTSSSGDNPVDREAESRNINLLNASGPSGEVTVINTPSLETEYSDFDDDWRWQSEDDDYEPSRHIH
jgi:DNA segregation ATPase FtsK/SpoIIIE-like protein